MTRERWDKRTSFIMAAIGSAIGLGNVWRFPYMVYSNGGGAFFIPYFIALVTTGIPLMAFEYYLGVRFQKGPSEAYGKLKKNYNYIGWFAVLVSSVICIYYTVVMAWSWNYIYHSFGVAWAGAEKDFFYNTILGATSGPGVLGGIKWPILFGNFLTWLCIFLILFKGIKALGKIVKWTVILPWVLLIIILIRGVTLPGALEGLEFYLKPDFSKLKNIDVWLDAFGQIFFSLSLGFGIMIAYASFLPKDSDINGNAWVVSFANCLTSFIAGFAIFSTLGYLAFSLGEPVNKVAGAGPGLAFVTFPAAISKLPGGIITQSLFGITFFFTLLTLGIDSAFSLVETIVIALSDTFKIKNKTKVLFWTCISGFLLGTIFVTKAGIYWLDIVDHWMNVFGLIVVGILEAILIGWLCDTKKIEKDLNSTSEIKFGKFWYLCVKFIIPVVLGTIIIISLFKEFKQPYENYDLKSIILGGWFLIITLFYFAILLQKRAELFYKIKNIYKIIGYSSIYAGFLYVCYNLYLAEIKELYVVKGIIIFITGIYLIKGPGARLHQRISG